MGNCSPTKIGVISGIQLTPMFTGSLFEADEKKRIELKKIKAEKSLVWEYLKQYIEIFETTGNISFILPKNIDLIDHFNKHSVPYYVHEEVMIHHKYSGKHIFMVKRRKNVILYYFKLHGKEYSFTFNHKEKNVNFFHCVLKQTGSDESTIYFNGYIPIKIGYWQN